MQTNPSTTAFEAATPKLRAISSGDSEDNGVCNFRNSVVFSCALDYAGTKCSRRRLRSSLRQCRRLVHGSLVIGGISLGQ